MRPEAELLFEDFAARYARGEHPDVRDYLERAGDERDALATLIDGYLASVPAQPPSEETLAAFAALLPGEAEPPPMLAMRLERGLRRSEVVRQLVRFLGLEPAAEEKVTRYYHELETGLLDPRGVSPRVWHCLATVLGPAIRSLMVAPYTEPPALVTAYYRRSDDLGSHLHERPMPAERPAERDEVDRLFTGNA